MKLMLILRISLHLKQGYTPLHLAAEKGHETICKMLVDRGANIDAKDKYGRTPLYNAITSEKIEISELLLNLGANVNARCNDGITFLHVASKKRYLHINERFLKHRACVNSAYVSTFRVHYGKHTPQCLAVEKEHEKVVRMLLDSGANIDAKDDYGRNPLHTAIENENMKITDLLLNSGANVNVKSKNGLTPLHIAAEIGSLQIVEHLLEHDVNSVITSLDRTLFQLSAQEGNEVISKMLLNKGANVNAKQKDGITALHIAAEEDHKEVVEVLLKCGAKVDFKDENGMTPLHIAVEKGYLEIVEILLKLGADIDSRDKYGRTALHIASEGECTEIVIVLLEHSSDVNIINNRNNTPLDVVMDGISSFHNRIYDYNYHYDEYYDDYYDDYYDYYSYFDRDICARKQIAEILIQHIVKMKTANLYVNEQNLSRSNNYRILDLEDEYEENLEWTRSSNNKIRDFTEECEKEVAIMKSEKINNTTISFYDILTKSTNSLAIYMRNENIMQVLKSDDYKTKFSIYANMIKNNFRKGMERKELLEHSNKFFYFLFNNFPELPHHCIEKIISYLSDEDLRILIEA